MQWVTTTTTKTNLLAQRSDVVNTKATICFSYITTMLTNALPGTQWIRDMGIWQQALAQHETLHQYYFNKTFSPLEGLYIFRMLRLPVSWLVNNHMHSCKSLDRPVKQARMPTGGFELKCSFHAEEAYQLEP